MKEIIEIGKQYIQEGINLAQNHLDTEPEMYVVVMAVLTLVIAYFVFKEIFDMLLGNNKGVLKRRNRELEERVSDLNERILQLGGTVFELESHTNAMVEELNALKSIKFDQVFKPELMDEVIRIYKEEKGVKEKLQNLLEKNNPSVDEFEIHELEEESKEEENTKKEPMEVNHLPGNVSI